MPSVSEKLYTPMLVTEIAAGDGSVKLSFPKPIDRDEASALLTEAIAADKSRAREESHKRRWAWVRRLAGG